MLGAEESFYKQMYKGNVFAGSAVETVTLPPTLRVLEEGTFRDCKNLRDIQLPQGLERIRQDCFARSGLAQITLPRSLKEVDKSAFSRCESLRTIYLEDGCGPVLSGVEVPAPAEVISLRVTVSLNELFYDLRQ